MSYVLGLDVGTAVGAAATKCDGTVQAHALGESGGPLPSSVLFHDDGSFLTGDAARRGGGTELARVARDLRRDPMAQSGLAVAGNRVPTGYSMLRALYIGMTERVCQLGEQVPSHVVITHPAGPDGTRCDIVERIADELFPGALLVPDPVAAAVKFACDCALPVEGNILVYDLGGGTLGLGLVQRECDRFTILGQPSAMSDLGGIDIDEMVLDLVDAELGSALSDLDRTDPATAGALEGLRASCRRAKEQLSSTTEATVDVAIPDHAAPVTVHREALEEALLPRLDRSIDAMEQMVRDAGLTMGDVDTIALVGGSCRIPLVARTITERTRIPIVVDDDPALTVALGAAQMVADGATAGPFPPIAGLPLAAPDTAGTGSAPGGAGLIPGRSEARTGPADTAGTLAAERTAVRSIGFGATARPGPRRHIWGTVLGRRNRTRVRQLLVGGSTALLVIGGLAVVGFKDPENATRTADGGRDLRAGGMPGGEVVAPTGALENAGDDGRDRGEDRDGRGQQDRQNWQGDRERGREDRRGHDHPGEDGEGTEEQDDRWDSRWWDFVPRAPWSMGTRHPGSNGRGSSSQPPTSTPGPSRPSTTGPSTSSTSSSTTTTTSSSTTTTTTAPSTTTTTAPSGPRNVPPSTNPPSSSTTTTTTTTAPSTTTTTADTAPSTTTTTDTTPSASSSTTTTSRG